MKPSEGRGQIESSRPADASSPARGGARRHQPLPRGPQALPREQVAAHQRERLFAAMIECIDERGFVASTISDLVERAGVSRRTFYEHFDNKEECLLATYDMLFAELVEGIAGVQTDDGDWLRKVEAVVEAIFEVTVRRPDAARLVCVELAAAGPAGVGRWDAGGAMLASFIAHELDGRSAGEQGCIPDPVARAIVGALRNILFARVRRRRSRRTLRAELTKILPELIEWIGSYHPSPEGVLHARSPEGPPEGQGGAIDQLRAGERQSHPPASLRGGRAPGTLSLSPSWSARGLPRGEHNLPRGFVAHNQRERIFDAIAKRTAAGGYRELGLEDIAAGAAVSLQTFYEHFESKEEAFLATYEVGHAKAIAAVRRALDLRLDWTANVRLGMRALLEFLASEPAFARLACVEILIAYPHVATRLDEANWSFAELLDLRLDASLPSRMPSTLVGEAIVGGIFELLHDHILHGRTDRLRELTEHATYIALAPLIGGEAAWAAASGD
ncbi:MAG: TetR/AcrR family transcriptional regulator [Solirubrobacteraceae bacterium]